MKFTKETAKRMLRTFVQAFLGYVVANLAFFDFTDDTIGKRAVIGFVLSAVAAGIAAVMNLTKEETNDE